MVNYCHLLSLAKLWQPIGSSGKTISSGSSSGKLKDSQENNVFEHRVANSIYYSFMVYEICLRMQDGPEN